MLLCVRQLHFVRFTVYSSGITITKFKWPDYWSEGSFTPIVCFLPRRLPDDELANTRVFGLSTLPEAFIINIGYPQHPLDSLHIFCRHDGINIDG